MHSISPIRGEYLSIPSTLPEGSAFTPLNPAEILPDGESGWISPSSHTEPVLECYSKHHLFSQPARPVWPYPLGGKQAQALPQPKEKRWERAEEGECPCCCPRKCHHGWTSCFLFFHHLPHFPDSPIHPSDTNSKIISNSQHTRITQIKRVLSTCLRAFQKDSYFLV